MRVVFAPLPWLSHAFPMVPLAWGMLAAGHDVLFLTGEEAMAVTDAGFPVVDAVQRSTLENNIPAVMTAVPDMFRSVRHLGYEEMVAQRPQITRLWDPLADGYVAAAERLRPDLIVYDPVFNAGLVAAAALDVPAVGHGYGPMRYTAEFLHEHARAAFDRRQVGLPKKTALIDLVPASLMESGPATWQMRFVPYNGADVLPAWLQEPPTRPRIAVTLGRATPRPTATGWLDHIMRAAREIDAEFVLTVNEATAEPYAPLPDNVRVTGWTPLRQLLGTCDAIVHHGGAGTMFTACVAGIPQLLIPEGLGYEYDARALEASGAGLIRTPDTLDTEAIATLLSDTALRTAAGTLREQFEQMPSPAEVAGEIIDFARS